MTVRSQLLAVLLVSGCSPMTGPVDSGVPTEAESPLAQRFLTDSLPWPVSTDATAAGLMVNAGINAQLQMREPRYRPIAVSRDVLAVVWPPQDKSGFDVAWGGFEKPWQRDALTNIAANQVASLDAIADGQGGAWVAMRLIDRREKLVLIHWSPGGAVTTERIDMPIGINPIRLPYLEACNDVTLGLSPDGQLDFIVRSDPNPLETRLFHGRRPANQSAPFMWVQVVNGRNARAPVLQGSSWDFGCKSALNYDGLGRAVLAVLVQTTSETKASISGRHSAVFTLGKDGRFWPKETAFMTVNDDHSEFRGLLDLASHPTGFVFGGPAVAYQRVPSEATNANPDGLTPFVYLDAYHPHFPLSVAFTGDRQLVSDYRFAATSNERLIGVQSGGQPVPRRGGKLLSDGCGQFALAVTDWDEPDLWSFNTLGKRCLDPRPAPVFRQHFTGMTSASFSHGYEAPYSIGVCLDDARQTLGICFGGHQGREQVAAPVSTLSGNALVTASVMQGQRDVAVDAGLTLEFSTALRDLTAAGDLYDLEVAEKVSGTWLAVAGSAARYQFAPRTALKPGNHYRLVVPMQNQLEVEPSVLLPWQTPTGRYEVIDFTTGGEGPVITDVWSEPFRLQSNYPRNDAGVPEFLVDDRALLMLGTTPLRMVLTGQLADDYGRSTIDAGLIRRVDGGSLPDGSVSIELDSRWVDVPTPRDAGEQETFVIELPAFFDRHGRAFEDRLVLLKTGYFPLTVVSAVPADQSTVAMPPAEILLRINRPDPELFVNATAFSIEQVSGLDGGTTVGYVPFSYSANAFEIHLTPTTPLQSGASYRVINRINPAPMTATTFAISL